MRGSYRTARIVETRNLFLGWLRHGIGAVEQEDRNLLVGLPADIHSAVNALGWLLPIDLSRRNLDAMALSSVAVLDQKRIPAQYVSYPMKWIAMPRHGLAGRETETTNYRGSVMKHDFVCHCVPYAASAPTLQCAPSESTNCASTPPKTEAPQLTLFLALQTG
jgi:hypothetical protein